MGANLLPQKGFEGVEAFLLSFSEWVPARAEDRCPSIHCHSFLDVANHNNMSLDGKARYISTIQIIDADYVSS